MKTKVNRPFAVFDIDGTLIRWQLYHAVVNQLAKNGLLGSEAYEKIKEARMSWKKREGSESFKEYERVIVRVFDDAISSLAPSDFQKAVDIVIKEYKDQVYLYTLEKFKQLKASGYFLLAISGSIDEIVGRVAKHYQFDDAVGSIYEQKDGKFTGTKRVLAHDKKTELEELVKKHGLTFEDSWAFGDTSSDIPLLEMVANPVAFNPDRKLYAAAKERAWPIVIERKNVIYELTDKNGNYVLK